MKTLNEKIKTVTEDEPYVYLTSEELTSLVKLSKIVHINIYAEVKRWCEDKEHYYPANGSHVALSKKDALKVVKDIAEWSEVKGEQTLTKVYVSETYRYNRNGDQIDGLYISL